MWTKDIRSGHTTEAEIQTMVFSFGLHVETKLLNDEVKPKSEGTRLPVTNDLEAKDRLLEQQLATLTTTGS